MNTVAELTQQVLDQQPDADDVALLGALYDAGLAWVQFPSGSGGQGLAPADQGFVDSTLRAAGRWQSPLMRNPVGIGMCAPTIATWGTDEQKRYLRDIWTGEKIWCQLFSEPGAGSDVASLATRAVRDGDDWIVNGRKVWTTLGPVASYGLLLARTDPDVPKHQGLTCFIVDMKASGVHVAPLRELTGETQFSEITFTDARIPDDHRIGPVGDGWKVAITTLMNERVSLGGSVEPRGHGPIARAVTAWQAAGPQIAANPSRRERLLALWVEAEVLRLGNVRAAALRQVGTPGAEGSVLKLAGALLSQQIADFAVTLCGAEALAYDYYTKRPPKDDLVGQADLGFLSSQQSTIAGGTTEVQKNILGERLLGLPREPQVDRGLPWSSVPRHG